MERHEKIAAYLDVELGRLACLEVILIEVTGEGEAAFERGLEALWCSGEAARRALFVLKNHAGDEAAWKALQTIASSPPRA